LVAGLKPHTYERLLRVPLYNREIRLKREVYLGPRSYFVTICCFERQAVFREEPRGRWALVELLKCSSKHRFVMHAYCVMPDHLHLVAQGQVAECDLLRFVDNFKQRTAYHYKQECGRPLWQSRYYDHVLRAEDQVEDVACYVWWNPVRAGLCAEPRQYSLSGSETIDWMKWKGEATKWIPPWKKAV
jgi:REP element-mobilizing transposase RayT